MTGGYPRPCAEYGDVPPLLPDHLMPHPQTALTRWIDEARDAGVPAAAAMALATAGIDGRPSARMVFVRAWGARGIEWITDDSSRKARDIAERADAAGVFYWPALGRQLRVEGPVVLLERSELDAYFARRRPETRAAAWAWRQGDRMETRGDLIRLLASARSDDPHEGAPPGWVGHRLEPRTVEFWQEDPDGVHDRLIAVREPTGWTMERLAP